MPGLSSRVNPATQFDHAAGFALPEYASSSISITSAIHGTQDAPW